MVRVDVGGYRLAAQLTAGQKPPVVFISGRGDDRTVWTKVTALLRGARATLAYDRAGLGDSDPDPAGGARPYSVLAGEVVALARALSVTGPFVVVGHSMGAVIARTLAARHPQLVAGLVLVDGSVDEVAMWPGVTTHDGNAAHARLIDYQAGAAELAGAQYPAVPSAVITRTPGRAWPGAPSPADVDQRWTRHQQATADHLGAILVIARDCGHYIHRENPELVASVIDAVADAATGGGTVAFGPAQAAAAGATMARTPGVTADGP